MYATLSRSKSKSTALLLPPLITPFPQPNLAALLMVLSCSAATYLPLRLPLLHHQLFSARSANVVLWAI